MYIYYIVSIFDYFPWHNCYHAIYVALLYFTLGYIVYLYTSNMVFILRSIIVLYCILYKYTLHVLPIR